MYLSNTLDYPLERKCVCSIKICIGIMKNVIVLWVGEKQLGRVKNCSRSIFFLAMPYQNCMLKNRKHNKEHVNFQRESSPNVKESWWNMFKIMGILGFRKQLQMLWNDYMMPIPHNSVRYLLKCKAGFNVSYKTLHTWKPCRGDSRYTLQLTICRDAHDHFTATEA